MVIITPNAVAYLQAINRIGFNPQQSAGFVTHTGASDMTLFATIPDTQKFIDSTGKKIDQITPFPFIMAARILAFRHWTGSMIARGQDPDPSFFAVNAQGLENWITRQNLVLNNRLLTTTLAELKLNKFTDIGKWDNFRSDVYSKLQSFRDTKYGIFLTVLIRKHTDVTPAMITATYETIEDELFETILLNDPFLDRDNKHLFAAISDCVSAGPLCTYIKKYEKTGDGRGAFLELHTVCNNPETKDLREKDMAKKLRNVFWTKHMNFEKYAQAHIEIHNLMANAGNDLTESDKVHWLITNASDHEYGSRIVIALSTQPVIATFDLCVAAFRRAMANNESNSKKEHDSRRISASDRSSKRSDPKPRTKSTGQGSRPSKPSNLAKDAPSGYVTKHNVPPKRTYGKFTDSKLPIHLESYKTELYNTIMQSDTDRKELDEIRAKHSRQVKSVETIERRMAATAWQDTNGDYHQYESPERAQRDDSSVGSQSAASASVASRHSRSSHRSHTDRQAAAVRIDSTSAEATNQIQANLGPRFVFANTSVNQFGHQRTAQQVINSAHQRTGPRNINNSPAWASDSSVTRRLQSKPTLKDPKESQKGKVLKSPSNSLTWESSSKSPAVSPGVVEKTVNQISKHKAQLAQKGKMSNWVLPSNTWDVTERNAELSYKSKDWGFAPPEVHPRHWGIPIPDILPTIIPCETHADFNSRPSKRRVYSATSKPNQTFQLPPPVANVPIPPSSPPPLASSTRAIAEATVTMASVVLAARANDNDDSDSDNDTKKPAYDITNDPTFLMHLAAITALLNPTSHESTPDEPNLASTLDHSDELMTDEPLPASVTNSNPSPSHASVLAITTEPLPTMLPPQRRARKQPPVVPFNTTTRNTKRKPPPNL